MSAGIKTITHTFADDSPVQLSSLQGEGTNFASFILLRAGDENTGTVTWADAAAGKAGGYLGQGEAASFHSENGYISTSQLWITSTSSNEVYITLIS